MTTPPMRPPHRGFFPLDFPAHIIYNILAIRVQEERNRTCFGSWNTKPVRLPEMLLTPLYLRNYP